MAIVQLYSDYSVTIILSLIILAFAAGFIDSVVGGGGLIQIPALLISLPYTPLPTLFGTNKIAALSGTTISAIQYSRQIKYDYRLLLLVSFFAAAASFAGAKVVIYINVGLLKPVVLIILIGIAVYTFINKDLGSYPSRYLTSSKQLFYGSILGLLVGFYDGFFGPGTGSFLVMGFVVILGFEFLQASAYAKVINCVTNISALVVFIRQGNYLLELGILMAIFNIAGSIVGTKMAIKRGNRFIRIIFLVLVTLMIIRYGYDIYF